MSSPPGWHPDPAPQQPGSPPLLRYWDGNAWTEHTAPAPSPVPADQPPAYPGAFGSPPYPTSGYDVRQQGSRPTTPDGEPLAGWWQRGLALMLDGLIVGMIAGVLSFPWWRDIIRDVSDWMQVAANEPAGTSPDVATLRDQIAHPLLVIGVVTTVVRFCYYVGFLLWRQALPGMMAVGLRVRLRERPGPMPPRAVVLRWLGHYGPALLGLTSVGGLSALYSLLDYLWPLWDGKRQALHDKLARTNVVRVR